MKLINFHKQTDSSIINKGKHHKQWGLKLNKVHTNKMFKRNKKYIKIKRTKYRRLKSKIGLKVHHCSSSSMASVSAPCKPA
jgi:hypothetical protein